MIEVNEIEEKLKLLESYLEKNEFKGWDPFDGLNSKIFQSSPFSNSRLFRLLWLQTFKISPVNFRKITGTKKEVNPNTLGIALTTLSLDEQFNEVTLKKVNAIVDTLESMSSKGWSGYCWGYNFDWQARAFFQPKYSPTVVPTTYIVCGLLDVYKITKEEKLLKIARSSCDFIINDLNRSIDKNGNICFSYSPLDNTVVYNATLLASKLLARVYEYTREPILIELAKSSVHFCLNAQNNDGSWFYGQKEYHKWIDNFHTGYNLECLRTYSRIGSENIEASINRGLEYYLNNLFEGSLAKYYNNKIYPIDLNAVSQLIITLKSMDKLSEHKSKIESMLAWVFRNMWNKNGYFYYQKNYLYTNKIPYIRWTQIWMYYALTLYFNHLKRPDGKV